MTPNPNPSPELRALADIFDHFKHSKQGPGHCHDVPGIWDADNASDKAGKPCEWCAKWERARAALISPQTLPAPGEVEEVVRIVKWIDEAIERTKRHGATEGVWLFGSQWRVVRTILATVAAANDEGDWINHERIRQEAQASGYRQAIEAAAKVCDDLASTAASMQAAIELSGGEAPIKNAQRETAETLAADIRLLSQGGGK